MISRQPVRVVHTNLFDVRLSINFYVDGQVRQPRVDDYVAHIEVD